MSKEIILQESYTRDTDVTHFVAESADDGSFTALRRGDGEEWTAWCRGEPLVDIADSGNGLTVDLHTENGIASLELSYDVAANLTMAIEEHMRNERAGGNRIIRRFIEAV